MCKGIHADVIVYIFANLHTTLRTEGNMSDMNCVQAAKELVVFQKLQNFWVAKALMSSYILCDILSF